MDKNVPAEVKDYLVGAYQKALQWSLPGNRGCHQTATPLTLNTVAVIGGGTMGRGIAISTCLAGYKTIIIEQNDKTKEWCRNELETTYKREKQFNRLNDEKINKLRSSLSICTSLNDCSNCDLVVEAVFENMNLKKDLWTKLDKICKESCIFGTNTSSLDIDEMSSVLNKKDRLVGIHFFNPANIIKMVEIVYGNYTNSTTIATAFEYCKSMKKLPVLVGNCPAFVFNRLLAVYLLQTQKLLYQYGLFPHHVDKTVTSFGFLMGPLTMADMNGLDVFEKLKNEHNWPLTVLETELLTKRKRYGRKNYKGFYKYDKVSKKKENDMEVEQIITELSSGQNVNIQLICDQDLINFLLYPMINEGYRCIEEGMIHDESLIDIMFMLGFGWPARHGGPMRYGRLQNIGKVANTIELWNSLEPEDRAYHVSKTLKNEANKLMKSKM